MTELSKDDRRFIADLLTWDAAKRSLEWGLAHVSLLVGCVVIGVAATAIASQEETALYYVAIPGFVVGMVLVGLYAFAYARVRERQRFARILRHLGCG
jgi:type IV secretory pathway VirB3-like protein